MTYGRIRGEFLERELDLVRVPGKDQPVKIYELLARKAKVSPEQEALARDFQVALVEYRKRNWDKARETFQAVLAKFPRMDRRNSTWNDVTPFLKARP